MTSNNNNNNNNNNTNNNFNNNIISVVLPLRIPLDTHLDIAEPLAAWLDRGDGPMTADECMDDLKRLSHLRVQVAATFTALPQALEALPLLQEYAAALLEFHTQGFVLETAQQEGQPPTSPLLFRWKTAPKSTTASTNSNNNNNHDEYDDDDNDDDDDEFDASGSLVWERANILWNICTLEAYKATLKNLTTKMGWVQAGAHFSNAAAVLRLARSELYPRHINNGQDNSMEKDSNDNEQDDDNDDDDQDADDDEEEEDDNDDDLYDMSHPHGMALSNAVLHIWESFLIAEAQRAAYEAFRTLARPRHFMLAKLAAAAVPLFQKVEDMLAHRMAAADDLLVVSTTPSTCPVLEEILMDWEDAVRAWGMWMSALTEYHQAVVHREKQEWGPELARLEGALRFGRLCQDFCESTDHPLEQGLDHFEDLLRQVEERQQEAEAESDGRFLVPDREDLPEIPMQKSVKEDPDVSKILPALARPFFTSIMDPTMRYYVQSFRSEMERAVFQTAQMGDDKTESARKALALVNLPHSLTAYRQEQNGGGIPEDLWERIDMVQQNKRDDRLKQELWELRDLADSARTTFGAIEGQLEEDLQMDSLFREQHGNAFEGHDVQEIQKTFRQTLKNYDRLMASAEESDALLLQRCEILDTDPKFRLLKFHKSQLDRLLPGRGDGMEGSDIDVSSLSKHLVDLSALFNDRESLVHTLRERVKTYNIAAQLQAAQGAPPSSQEAEYQKIVDIAIESYDDMIRSMHQSIDLQDSLLEVILKENEDFIQARDVNQSSASSESFIVKIEDALEEIDQFSEHLKEGRAFYDVIIPKLNKLKQQVGDVSARLTIERCEYEDKLRRNRQEADDARMAASFDNNSSRPPAAAAAGGGGGGGDAGSYDDGGHASLPGVHAVSHDEPDVRVDDEKVASLVAMDFDPDRVVAALKKYDNNVDQALNELLGC